LSGLKKISRAISGKTDDVIAGIFVNDLNVNSSRVKNAGNPISKFNGVLNIQTPLSAIKWLSKKTFDNNGSPFVVHQTVSTGNIFIASYLDMLSAKPFGSYWFDHTFTSTPGTSAAFAEQSSRILSLQSNIALNRFEQARSGAFASRTNFLDVASKTYYSRDFSTKEKTTGLNFFTGRPTEKPSPLTSLQDASINEVSLNTLAYHGPDQNNARSGGFDVAVQKAYAAMANSESWSHVIVLHGNFELNPGRIIELNIPQAYAGAAPSVLDSNMSGKYLIRHVVHSFDQGTYQSTLKVIRV
jgi:hypothetical protein